MLALCERFSKLPDEIERHGAELVRLLNIEELGGGRAE